jgi:hypothetical protein
LLENRGIHDSVLVTALAFVKDRGAFIGASQLLSVVANLFATTLFARMLDNDAGLHIVVVDGLHFGSLCAQRRWEGGGLGVCDDSFGGGV